MRANEVESSTVWEMVRLPPSDSSARKSSRRIRFPSVISGPPARASAISPDDARQSQQLARERRALFLARRQVDGDGRLAVDQEHPERQPRLQGFLARGDG